MFMILTNQQNSLAIQFALEDGADPNTKWNTSPVQGETIAAHIWRVRFYDPLDYSTLEAFIRGGANTAFFEQHHRDDREELITQSGLQMFLQEAAVRECSNVVQALLAYEIDAPRNELLD